LQQAAAFGHGQQPEFEKTVVVVVVVKAGSGAEDSVRVATAAFAATAVLIDSGMLLRVQVQWLLIEQLQVRTAGISGIGREKFSSRY